SKGDSAMLDIVQSSPSPGALLLVLADQSWLSDSQQKLVLQTALRVLSTSTRGERFTYQRMQQRYLDFLIKQKDAPTARQVFETFSDAEKRSPGVRQSELQLAVLEGALAALLDRYKQLPSEAPQDW